MIQPGLPASKGGYLMGKFLLKKTATGFNFHLLAGNGESICISEVYKLKASCLNGIKSVRVNAPLAGIEDHTQDRFKKCLNPKFEIFESKKGDFRFRLRARNGQIIACSEGYKALASCINGIESVRKNAPDATIVEEE